MNHSATAATASSTFVAFEKELAAIGFFLPIGRREPGSRERFLTVSRTVAGKRVEGRVRILPHERLGHPISPDQERYLALMKIAAERRPLARTPDGSFAFCSSDLLRVLGRRSSSGPEHDRIRDCLDVMTGTRLISEGGIYNAAARRFEHSELRVIELAARGGGASAGGGRRPHRVLLPRWQADNLSARHFILVSLDACLALRCHTAKILVPLPQVWTYASRGRRRFEKSYEEFCRRLGLAMYSAESRIISELGPALDELVAAGFIAGWNLVSGKRGRKLVLFHNGREERRDANSRIPSEPAAPVRNEPPLAGELIRRGISERTARRIAAETGSARLLLEQLEWGDSVVARNSRIRNPAGFYIHLIRENIRPPGSFLAGRARAQEGERERLELAHRDFIQRAVDRHIEEGLGQARFRELKQVKAGELTRDHPGIRNWEPAVFERFLESAVRSDIERELRLPPLEDLAAPQARGSPEEREDPSPATGAAPNPGPGVFILKEKNRLEPREDQDRHNQA